MAPACGILSQYEHCCNIIIRIYYISIWAERGVYIVLTVKRTFIYTTIHEFS